MLKHIVFWRLKDEAMGNTKEVNAQLIRQKLRELRGRVPGLKKVEVGIDLKSNKPDQGDVVLYSVFDSRTALEIFCGHPLHKTVEAFISEVALERRVVDYEMFPNPLRNNDK